MKVEGVFFTPRSHFNNHEPVAPPSFRGRKDVLDPAIGEGSQIDDMTIAGIEQTGLKLLAAQLSVLISTRFS